MSKDANHPYLHLEFIYQNFNHIKSSIFLYQTKNKKLVDFKMGKIFIKKILVIKRIWDYFEMDGNWKNITSSPQSLCSRNFPNLKWEKKSGSCDLISSFCCFGREIFKTWDSSNFQTMIPNYKEGKNNLLTKKFSLGFHGAKLGAILWQNDFRQWCMASQKISIGLKKFQTLIKKSGWVLGIDMVIRSNTNPIIKNWLA